SNLTVFSAYLSNANETFPSNATAFTTFTVGALPPESTNNNNNYSATVTATFVLPSDTPIGSYKISLGAGGSANNSAETRPYIIGSSGQNPSTNSFSVTAPPVGGTITPATTSICSSSTSGLLTLTGNTGSIVRWEQSTNDFLTYSTATNLSTEPNKFL